MTDDSNNGRPPAAASQKILDNVSAAMGNLLGDLEPASGEKPAERAVDFFECPTNRMEFAIQLPRDHVIRYAFMIPRPSAIRDANGKQQVDIVPIVVYDFLPDSESVEHYFACCPAGQTLKVAADGVYYRATLVNPMTADVLGLFEVRGPKTIAKIDVAPDAKGVTA